MFWIPHITHNQSLPNVIIILLNYSVDKECCLTTGHVLISIVHYVPLYIICRLQVFALCSILCQQIKKLGPKPCYVSVLVVDEGYCEIRLMAFGRFHEIDMGKGMGHWAQKEVRGGLMGTWN